MTSESSSLSHEVSDAGSFAELWRVALPLILSSASLTLMHVTDRMFVSWYSKDALAASMPAGMLNFSAIALAWGTCYYVNAFVAQYLGAGRKDRVATSVWQGIYFALGSSVLVTMLVPAAGPIFRLIGHEPHVQQMEVEYFQILCAGSVFFLLSTVLSCFFSGRGQTRVVMWVDWASVLLNIVLDYVLIFGWGPFPEWGMFGAGFATIASRAAATAVYIAWILLDPELEEYQFWQNRRFDGELFRRLLKHGLPNGVQFLVDIAGFTVFILILGQIGTEELAASNLAFNLNSLAFLPLMGIGTAVTTLVGQRVGEQRPELAVKSTWSAFKLSSWYLAIFIALFLSIPRLMLYPYKHQNPAEFAEIEEISVVLLRYVCIYTYFDALAVIFGSAIRGAGDTKFSLLFSFTGCWSLMVAPPLIAQFQGRNSLHLSWAACSIYIVVMGIGYVLRFQGGKWKSMSVIEREPESLPDLQPAIEPASTETVDVISEEAVNKRGIA